MSMHSVDLHKQIDEEIIWENQFKEKINQKENLNITAPPDDELGQSKEV